MKELWLESHNIRCHIIWWVTSVEHLKPADAMHSIYVYVAPEEVRDAALTDTGDWLRTVTKWIWLPQWCDAQFICQTNYTQMPHSLSFLASQNLYSSPFYFCRTHCSLLLQRFEKCRGSFANSVFEKLTYIRLFAVELTELQRHTLNEETVKHLCKDLHRNT